MTITHDDLRAATAAGVVTEEQAARLSALAHERAGRIAKRASEDEPFELFSGFAEIFISLGLVLFSSGLMVFGGMAGGMYGVMITLIALGWFGAEYFTVKRRMSLPSIVLVCSYASGVGGLLSLTFENLGLTEDLLPVLAFGCLGSASLILHYRRFRVPFTMLLIGAYVFFTILFIATDQNPFMNMALGGWEAMFDLRQGSGLATGTLIFGALAFATGLWFDVQDPHRIGRRARSAFWCHLMAAPALVNTLMMTVYNMPGATGTLLTLLGFLLVTALALVIDRRSFLTAGLGYVAAIIFYLISTSQDDLSIPLLMLLFGAFITLVGSFWTQLRNRLMRTLPNFPGKSRLPPYDTPA